MSTKEKSVKTYLPNLEGIALAWATAKTEPEMDDGFWSSDEVYKDEWIRRLRSGIRLYSAGTYSINGLLTEAKDRAKRLTSVNSDEKKNLLKVWGIT